MIKYEIDNGLAIYIIFVALVYFCVVLTCGIVENDMPSSLLAKARGDLLVSVSERVK